MDSEGGRVLVVHGNPTTRDVLRGRLEEAGHSVLVARDGPEALTAVKRDGPDILVLDVHTPEIDAQGFLASLKAESESRVTPVIVLAQEGEGQIVERCLELGADDYLLAPYSATLLKAQVSDYLRIGARRRQELRRVEREELLKIDRDVQIARQIQIGFLPSELPQPNGWEVAARFYPARQVAGDFYDAFPLTQGRRVGLVIADICDKGVGAALFMALFRSLIRAYAQQHYSLRWTDILDDKGDKGKDRLSPGGARSRLSPSTGTTALRNAMELTNDYIARNHADTNIFATTFFGVLDPTTGQLTYVNAGHNPPVVLGESGVKARLQPTGPALGMLPDIEYRIGQVALEPGDVLFTFTDGVTDTRDPSRALFTEKRMLSLIERPAVSATALLDRVDEALHSHMAGADQFDDITMLAARRGI